MGEWSEQMTRKRRTPEQMIPGIKRRLKRVKSDAKKLEKAMRTRQAVILGEALRGMAKSGDVAAELMVNKIMAGLKRKQDRIAFGLEPLPEPEPEPGPGPDIQPEPDNQPAANSSEPDLDVRALDARVSRAVDAWNNGSKSAELQSEFVDAVVAFETLTGRLFAGIEDRPAFGLSDRPGVLV
jgi:hypothetical protein